jgi:hypothetical protein
MAALPPDSSLRENLRVVGRFSFQADQRHNARGEEPGGAGDRGGGHLGGDVHQAAIPFGHSPPVEDRRVAEDLPFEGCTRLLEIEPGPGKDRIVDGCVFMSVPRFQHRGVGRAVEFAYQKGVDSGIERIADVALEIDLDAVPVREIGSGGCSRKVHAEIVGIAGPSPPYLGDILSGGIGNRTRGVYIGVRVRNDPRRTPIEDKGRRGRGNRQTEGKNTCQPPYEPGNNRSARFAQHVHLLVGGESFGALTVSACMAGICIPHAHRIWNVSI